MKTYPLQKGKNKGFTLIEIMIASFIALILLSIIMTVFIYGKQAYDYANYSHRLSEESYVAIKWLKADLAATSLGTIRVYPEAQNAVNDVKPAGISFESAFDPQTGQFTFGDYGTPDWKKHVFYTVKETGVHDVAGKKIKVGDLYRWEKNLPDKNPIPYATSVLPSDEKEKDKATNKRVLIRNIVIPGQDIYGDKEVDKYGGFKLFFIRRDPSSGKETLSTTNPAQVSDTGSSLKTSGNTEIIQLKLTILETSNESGKPEIFDLSFRIKPKN